jgi:hypothetical protein
MYAVFTSFAAGGTMNWVEFVDPLHFKKNGNRPCKALA